MHILVVEPERKPDVREIDGSLKSMQEVVGGLIQPSLSLMTQTWFWSVMTRVS